MQIELVKKSSYHIFYDIKVGEMFYQEDELYIRVPDVSLRSFDGYNSIKVGTNFVAVFNDNVSVTPVTKVIATVIV